MSKDRWYLSYCWHWHHFQLAPKHTNSRFFSTNKNTKFKIFTTKHTNSHFFDTRLFTPTLSVTNIRYVRASWGGHTNECKWPTSNSSWGRGRVWVAKTVPCTPFVFCPLFAFCLWALLFPCCKFSFVFPSEVWTPLCILELAAIYMCIHMWVCICVFMCVLCICICGAGIQNSSKTVNGNYTGKWDSVSMHTFLMGPYL